MPQPHLTSSPLRPGHTITHHQRAGCHIGPFSGRAGWDEKECHVLCILPEPGYRQTDQIPSIPPTIQRARRTPALGVTPHTRAQQGLRHHGGSPALGIICRRTGRRPRPGSFHCFLLPTPEQCYRQSEPRPGGCGGQGFPSSPSFPAPTRAPTPCLWPASSCKSLPSSHQTHTCKYTHTHTHTHSYIRVCFRGLFCRLQANSQASLPLPQWEGARGHRRVSARGRTRVGPDAPA